MVEVRQVAATALSEQANQLQPSSAAPSGNDGSTITLLPLRDLQRARDSYRKRVQEQRRVRRPGRHRTGWHPRMPTTAAWYYAGTTGVRSVSHPSGITSGTMGLERSHGQHMIRLPTTGAQHNGRSYHTIYNEPSAQRASVPHRHNGHRHDGSGTTHVHDARFATSKWYSYQHEISF